MTKNKSKKKPTESVTGRYFALPHAVLDSVAYVGAGFSTKALLMDMARANLNILHPSGRIQELKQRGYQIETIQVTTEDDYGRRHRAIARYVLKAENEVTHG